MSVSAPSVAAALAAIVGAGGVRDDGGSLVAAAIDGRVPRWVARPASLEHLSRVVALAQDAGLALAPRGSGSALELGHPPERLDLVLDLHDLAAVVEWSPDDLTVTVQAGLTAGALAARLAARHQFLPLDPPGVASRTLGGITATNASGPLRARYGTMRDLLLGVRFVQADGVLTMGGAKVVKSVTGYDVPKLLVGSLGTLGILGELILRLHPMPEVERTWLASFDSTAGAQQFVAALLDSTVQASRVELLGGGAGPAVGGRGGAAVAVTIGPVGEAVRAPGAALPTFAGGAGGDVAPAPDGFWRAYERAVSAGEIILRVATLASHLAETVEDIARAVGATVPGARAVVAGCAPFGALRVSLDRIAPDAARVLVERLREALAPLGGSVVIERAPAAVRAGVDPWGPIEPGALALMRALKAEFDPRRCLNPGRFVGGI
jgi:glycolate oxidase FAD binding subunit